MNFTIGNKLLGGFLSVAIILGIISSISYYNIQKVDKSFSDLVDRRAVIESHALKMEISTSQEISSLRGVLLQEKGTPEALAQVITDLNEHIEAAYKLANHQDLKDTLTQLETLNEQFKLESDQIISLMNSSPDKAEKHFLGVAMPLVREIRDISSQIAIEQAELMKEESLASSALVSSVTSTVLTLSVIAIILAILIGVIITRMITKPILLIEKMAEGIASGDLAQEDIMVKNRDEIGNLAKSFNQMKMNLRQLIQQVSLDAEQVAATSEQLSAGAEQTGKATEQISIAIQEVALGSETQVSHARGASQAVIEISNGMNQAAFSIQSVADLTTSTSEKAAAGNTVVTQTVEQINLVQQSVSETREIINALGEKSEEIGQIVELITQIADQTNLLALNAAIEAARAGEHGRGFSVVADEVRKLAVGSGQAAGQIRNLIIEIQAESENAVQSMNLGTSVVGEGINMVHQTGEVFKDILMAIEQVTEEAREVSAIIGQVNSSSQSMVETMEALASIAEQSAGNTQNVAASVEEQNASMEEISASTIALSSMAQDLQEVISTFKV
ncbi:methyl-accepting chemotaxis protein [Sporosarcina beigongshangi]|uniref:methyl-accepting chemotaxis protein n=1 Tax=Sporosarcina beigongshangi TaxID=2782538 RepID=UPI0019394710|nr:methyl-accepting chemotaxis protein [Sporosarcina beigongshangi]